EQSPDDDEMLTRFHALYADPVLINGAPVPARDLLTRARAIAAGLADVQRTVLDVVEGPHRVAFAFRLSGRHIGSLPTPAGPVAATSQQLDVLGIDILQLDADGRICAITVLSGLLDSLAGVGAVAVTA
ncbi:MAG: hypothetical protein QOC80_1368, partial [Frankiaceae bacterium]|nr:hypothetical protein [Frankiaceae bacterium]